MRTRLIEMKSEKQVGLADQQTERVENVDKTSENLLGLIAGGEQVGDFMLNSVT